MKEKQYIILADLDRCIGCRGGCQVACKTEHSVALGPSRSTLYTMGPTGVYPDLEMYFLPVMCQQCKEPECARVCPTGACYKGEEDGVVRVNRDVCIGCQTCIRACPYGANFYNKELRVADKCDICAERRDRGEPPACVRNCAGAALYYGDANDPESEVSRRAAEAGEGNVYALPETGGCKPSGRFILKTARWLGLPPQAQKKEA